MSIVAEEAKKRLDTLIEKGNKLYYSLVYENANDEQKRLYEKQYAEIGIDVSKLPSFNIAYEIWYSEALQFVKKFIPERTADFIALYKNEKRKEVTHLTYTISDAIIGLVTSRAGEIITDSKSALPKMLQQISILRSAKKLIDSVIYSMDFSIRADLFDSELDAAEGLIKSGFLRAAGAMCGVVLEKHLHQVCVQHGIVLKKKSPTINDYNEELKNAAVIDLPTWRHIQLLGDLRNLCCHNKHIEPTKEQTTDLLNGAIKITKTVY